MKINFKNKWNALPDYLRVIVIISMMIPFAALPLLLTPEILKPHYILFVMTTFCLFPLLLVATIFLQSLYVVPVYFLESLLMILFSYQYIKMESFAEELFRLIAMLALLVGGTFILSRDHIIPLVHAKKRNKWRQSRRLKVEELVKIQFENDEAFRPIVLHNCSESGLSFSGFYELSSHLSEDDFLNAKENLCVYKLKVGTDLCTFKANIAWIKITQDVFKIGLKLEPGSRAYYEIYRALEFYRSQNTNWLRDAWHKPEIRRLALAVWVVSVASNIFAPSCGRQDEYSDHLLRKAKNVITIPVVVGSGAEGFQLSTLINDYEIEVKGCKSAYSKVIRMTSPDPNLKLPEGDVGCRAYLNFITLNSDVYTNINGVNFDPSLGAHNVFENSQQKSIIIKTWLQLTDPITVGAAISFEIVSESKGTTYSMRGPAVSRVGLSANTSSINERQGTVTFTLTRDAYISTPLTVNLRTSGTAVSGSDYTALNNYQSFAAGQSSISFSVSTIDDTVSEVSETLILEVLPGTGYWGLDSVTVTIIDNDSTTLLAQPFWYDGTSTSPSTVGTSIRRINDKSGNRNHANQNKKKSQALLDINANQNLFLDFDGLDDIYIITEEVHINLGALYKEKTFYLAFEIENSATTQVLYEQGGEAAGFSIVYSNGEIYFGAWNLSANASQTWGPVFVSTPVSMNQLYYVKAEFDAWSGELRLELNGQQSAASVNFVGDMNQHGGSIGLGAANSGTRLSNGAFVSGNTNFFSGKLYEVRSYNSILSAQDSLDMDNYFFSKYSISP